MTKMTASDAAEILLRTIRIETPLQEKAVAMAVAALKKSEADDVRMAVERWTPMDEKSPEENGKYLCVWQGKSIETGMFLNGHFRLYGEIKDRLVSHWRPLPELPKEEPK